MNKKTTKRDERRKKKKTHKKTKKNEATKIFIRQRQNEIKDTTKNKIKYFLNIEIFILHYTVHSETYEGIFNLDSDQLLNLHNRSLL